jgi:alkylhydroperoxidase family enzyme
VRFHSARAAGLNEERASAVDDDYAIKLEPPEVAALRLTDAIIGNPEALSPQDRAALDAHYAPAAIGELALGVGLFLGMSKVLILLGLEPESMPVTVLPTPGSAGLE